MACSIAFDRTSGDSTVTVTGVVASEDIIAALQELWQQPARGHKRLWDVRHADLSGLGSDDLLMLKEFVEAHRPPGPGVRVAVVVGSANDFAVGRMGQSYMETLTAGFHVCFSLDEAREWLLTEPGGD